MFSALWTTLAFLLSGPPFHYSSLTIGLFGLAGAGGALMASVAGRLVDRSLEKPLTVAMLVASIIGFVFLLVGSEHLWSVLVGIVVLDVGTQGLHVTNQAIIYQRRPEARSRVTTIYMVTFFIGGTIGSSGASVIYGYLGWNGVCGFGILVGVLALLLAAIPFFRAEPGHQSPLPRDTQALT